MNTSFIGLHNGRLDTRGWEAARNVTAGAGNEEICEIGAGFVLIFRSKRYNHMANIDRWVICNTLAFAARLEKQKAEKMIFLNLSGTSFNSDELVPYVNDQLNHSSIDPNCICFEVTETAAISNILKAQKFIQAIREMGCQFALDEFGSGLSSFGYLKELPVDYLKIDGVFARDIMHSQKDFSIVKAMTQVGRSLGIKTVAEFVENRDIISKLKSIEVDYAQGYAPAKPEPLSVNDTFSGFIL